MKDTKEFESLLEKSRKLQALIADGSGATEGERQAALAALDRLLARYRLTPDALAVLLSARPCGGLRSLLASWILTSGLQECRWAIRS